MKKLIQITILVVFMVSCVPSGLEKDYKSEQAQAIQPEEVGEEDYEDERFMEGDPG